MSPILEVTGLSKTYASGQPALEDVNLAIDKGEIFTLLGGPRRRPPRRPSPRRPEGPRFLRETQHAH